MPRESARDGDRVLPGEHLPAEGTGDLDLARRDVTLRGEVADEPDDLHVVQVLGQLGRGKAEDDREDALALLARGLRDELLGPVRETDDVGAVRDDSELVLERVGRRDRRGEDQARILGGVDGQFVHRALGLVEQRGDVDPGQPRRHEAERGERGVAPAHVGVGVEHPVAVRAGGDIQRRARVRHDHDPRRRVDARVVERPLVEALLAVGLDRAAGLGRDHERGRLQPVAQGVQDLTGFGGNRAR